MVEPYSRRLVRQISDGLEQGERYAPLNDGRDLQQMLIFRRDPVDTSP
jgi:hypothetical protein